MLNIEETKTYRFSFLHLGFRPFFLFASLFAVISMLIWAGLYTTQSILPVQNTLPAISWHAHEMLYGYTLAVIAGFLLTAVHNWTGVQTLNGIPLLLLALVWLLARIFPFINHPDSLMVMAIFDLGFNILLCLAILYPITKVKQWKQMGLWLTVFLLSISNMLFYLGLFNKLDTGITLSFYSGIYLIVYLIMLMGRRVIPFFIEKGVDETVSLTNYQWLDISIIILMPVFWISEVFVDQPAFAASTALLLFGLNALRLKGWYTPGIWNKPLLWILYLAYGWLVLGFALKAAGLFMIINPMLAIHAFTFGGIGLMTLGMMARVALGHTGRNVFAPPAILKWIFLAAVAGSIFRVLLPLFAPQFYALWISLSQAMWIISFGLFVFIYAPILYKPRIDGKYG